MQCIFDFAPTEKENQGAGGGGETKVHDGQGKVEVRLIGKRRVKKVRVDGTKMTDTI